MKDAKFILFMAAKTINHKHTKEMYEVSEKPYVMNRWLNL